MLNSTISVAGAAEGEWQTLPTMPTARSEIHAAVLNNTIYVAGGIGFLHTLNVCEALDLNTQTWQNCPALPRRLHHVAIAADEQYIYAAGGYTSVFFQHDQAPMLWSLMPGASHWQPVSPLPEPVGEHAMIYHNGYLYLIGGNTPIGASAKLWRFSLKAQQWTQAADMPTARHSFAAVLVGDEIWVLGGRSQKHGTRMAQVEIYHTQTDQWRQAKNMPVGRGGHSAGLLNQQIHVFGGEVFNPNALINRHDIFDLKTARWLTEKPLPLARHGTAAVSVENGIIVIGGGTLPALKTVFALENTVQLWRTPQ